MTEKIESIRSKKCPKTKDGKVFKLFETNDRNVSAKNKNQVTQQWWHNKTMSPTSERKSSIPTRHKEVWPKVRVQTFRGKDFQQTVKKKFNFYQSDSCRGLPFPSSWYTNQRNSNTAAQQLARAICRQRPILGDVATLCRTTANKAK